MRDETKGETTVKCKTIAQAFEEQVRRTPDATAVVSAGTALTYRELDGKANQLARHLQSLGVGPDSLVGIAIERSVEMMVGLLAILKAGGAYVPMDPGYPEQRIRLMIEDSGARVILATERTRNCAGDAVTQVVSLDGDAEVIATYSTEAVESAAAEDNLAYVIYTSGSTGRPKGVMIEHRNVLNFFRGMDEAIGSEPGVWLAVTSISFDISVLELFWTLTRGFQVVIHGEESMETIPEEIRRYGVTHFQSTPSLARMIAVDVNRLAALGALKKMFLGGEALTKSLVQELRQAFKGELFNMYGPTETTIWSTVYKVTEESEVIPIGTPIVKTQVYVLDEQLHPVETGEVGDLYIGGDGVTRGYWQRPELTAEKFLADPFVDGNRMYRTGDIARFRADGNLEFLGRADFQVKLRGFRIEMGEIESAIESQAGVQQAAVIAWQFSEEDIRLVAYVVRKPGAAVEAAELRTALGETLPKYMVPSNFIFMDSLPLTANGKTDRKALPDPTPQERPKTAVELPASEMEQIIAEAWQDALGVSHVGLEENFFDLGAHSMMVAEVHIQLQQRLEREFSLVDLFQFPTVKALSEHLNGVIETPTISSRAARRVTARQRVRTA